ncbi:MAG TPA: Fic family protein, partial [Methanosphaera sp.]|nr:Fic family protein [Methanosphaera sp.]
MFDAKFQYTNKIINNLMEISSVKEFILNSKILPSYDLLLKNKAIISSSYNSTSIEGNPLDFKQVTELFNLKENDKLNEVNLNKSEIEVVNYFKTLESLDKYEKIDEKTILEIHKNITEGTLNDPDMAGRFRDTPVVIGNLKTGKLNFVPPSPIKVPYLIGELLDWINVQNELNPIILAGILHYEFVRIHPFVDGNGRTARALATLILLLNDFNIKGYFSLDEYYNQDRQSYYSALQSADKS